jgi:hypothetical protein
MNRISMLILLTAGTLLLCNSLPAQQAPATQPAAPPQTQPTQADLDTKFAQTMTGATLVGHFNAHGTEQNAHDDHYTIVGARKLGGDLWVITAKIEYRGASVAIPLVVPVKWAGDTPVISVTDMTIPGMGSYTARVMIYKDQYSGMWDAGTHGGLMWGKIEHAPPATAPTTAPAALDQKSDNLN